VLCILNLIFLCNKEEDKYAKANGSRHSLNLTYRSKQSTHNYIFLFNSLLNLNFFNSDRHLFIISTECTVCQRCTADSKAPKECSEVTQGSMTYMTIQSVL
jgi:hypothetical protein